MPFQTNFMVLYPPGPIPAQYVSCVVGAYTVVSVARVTSCHFAHMIDGLLALVFPLRFLASDYNVQHIRTV